MSNITTIGLPLVLLFCFVFPLVVFRGKRQRKYKKPVNLYQKRVKTRKSVTKETVESFVDGELAVKAPDLLQADLTTEEKLNLLTKKPQSREE